MYKYSFPDFTVQLMDDQLAVEHTAILYNAGEPV
jgi:hypothetical protein